jgi:truncated hemoglobin YjbI
VVQAECRITLVSEIPFFPWKAHYLQAHDFESQEQSNIHQKKMKQIYRNNIVHRMGGESGFDFIVLTYCENILEDENLDQFFANFDLKSLTFFQKELLLLTFLEPDDETNTRRKRVKFRHELMGLDRTYFAVMEKHFVDALDDCFVTGLDYELCKAYFAELFPVFKEVEKVSKYNDHVVQRMGGEATFTFLVTMYCERIHDDPRMKRFFGSLSLHSLTFLQKELVLMAFTKPSAENKIDAIKSKVTLKFSPIFELGLNDTHFDILEGHFSSALHKCSTKPDVTQTCQKLFATLLPFFQENAISALQEEETEEASKPGLSRVSSRTGQFVRGNSSTSMSWTGQIVRGESIVSSTPMTSRRGKFVSQGPTKSLESLANTEITEDASSEFTASKPKKRFLWRRKTTNDFFSWKNSGFINNKKNGGARSQRELNHDCGEGNEN